SGFANITILSTAGFPPSTNVRVHLRMDVPGKSAKELHKTKAHKSPHPIRGLSSIDDIAHNLGWEADIYPDQLVAQYVRRLRMKIERDPSTPQFIITEPGRRSCYRLELA
ncbi:MAG: hypothetical protein ABSA33_07465, partial [Candidatus Micrarchaeaceae archaeon]